MIEWPIRIYNTKGGKKVPARGSRPGTKKESPKKYQKTRVSLQQKSKRTHSLSDNRTTRKKKIGYSWKTMAIFDYFSVEINRGLKGTLYTLQCAKLLPWVAKN